MTKYDYLFFPEFLTEFSIPNQNIFLHHQKAANILRIFSWYYLTFIRIHKSFGRLRSQQ
ncbi:hypothetical protein ECSTEC7V_1202 [Escherichia coli STEC_7v]|nr:hypothetical protein ECSTEC7V_1202 [Escherichia coli STEC_7v]